MKSANELIYEAQVLDKLSKANSKTNLTLKQLKVPRSTILSLRRKGYDIISVPGRYNSGYNLNQTSKLNCLIWINRVRKNALGLKPNYKF